MAGKRVKEGPEAANPGVKQRPRGSKELLTWGEGLEARESAEEESGQDGEDGGEESGAGVNPLTQPS